MIAMENANERLRRAIDEGRADLVKQSLEEGANANLVTDEGGNTLTMAVLKQNGEIVSMLLDAGANPNAVHWDNSTTLKWAARTGRLDLVELLLAKGAWVAAEPDREETSVHVAAEEDFREIL